MNVRGATATICDQSEFHSRGAASVENVLPWPWRECHNGQHRRAVHGVHVPRFEERQACHLHSSRNREGPAEPGHSLTLAGECRSQLVVVLFLFLLLLLLVFSGEPSRWRFIPSGEG